MADKTFNDVKINLTLKPQTARANVSSNQEDLAVQMGKIQQWYPGLNNYATCATAAATAIKTVDCPGFELTTGTVIIVKFTVTNTAAVADLKLDVNSTGAKNIKYRNANLSAANILTANRIYAMLYDGTYWQIIGDLDTNSNTYDRTSVQTRIYAGAKGVFPYSLCAMDTAQRMQAFTTTGGTGTSKVFNSSEKFLYPPVIMYHSANSTIANGSVIANNVLYEQYPSVNMQYNANVTTSSAYSQYKPLYIECTFDSNGYWSPTGIAQTFTSGKYYILLGCMYNTSIYQLALFAQHPLYYYDGTNLIDGESHLQDGRYLPIAGGTMDSAAEITIPNGSHSSKYTGYGMYHYIGAGNGWARGINVNSATDGTRIGTLGMYGNANATEPSFAFFGKAYNDAWYELYKTIFRINDNKENGFQFRYKPSSLSSGYIGSFLSLYPGDTYGYGIVLGHSHGGLTVVGGGESGKAITDTFFDASTSPYTTTFAYDSEEVIIGSDSGIWFVSGANGLTTSAHTDWTNVKTALFDSSGNFRPSVDNQGSIGTSSFKWASIHGTTIYENGTALASKYAAISHTHDSLVPKALTKETLANTAGSFFFSGTSLLDNTSYDWIGIQAGYASDKWQLTSLDAQPFIRQNDSDGTEATHWSAWKGLIIPSSVTGEKGITVTTTQTTLGSGDSAVSYDSGVKIGIGTSLTISGLTYNTTVYGTNNPKIFFGNNSESQNIELQFTDYDSIAGPASLTLIGNQGNEYFIAPQICAKSDAAAGTASSQNMTMTRFGLYSRSYRAGTSQNHAQYVFRTFDGKSNSANGQLIAIGGGGLTIIGGGESATSLANLIDDDQTTTSPAKLTPIPDSTSEGGAMIGDTENMIVASDQSIYFLSNCGTIANRSGWYINTLSKFIPLKTKTHDIGATDHLVNNIYASNFVGYEPNQTTSTLSFNGLIINLPSNTLSGWSRGMLMADSGGNRLGGIGMYGTTTNLEYIWIGQTYNNTWCTFKSTNIDVQVPVTRAITNYAYIAARKNAIIYSNYANETTNSHFYPALFSKSQSGGWAIGTLSNSNALKFSYTTDADYDSNTNTSKTYDISTDGRFSGSATKLYVTTNTSTTGTTFRLLFADNTDSAGDRSVQNSSGLYYYSKAGTTSAAGLSQITLGNAIATGSANNRSGAIAFYSSSTHYGMLAPISLTATRTWSFPDETGEIMIRSTANSGNQPVLYASSVNYSTNPLEIEVTNIFSQWKVVYVVLERIIYGNGADTAVSFQFLIPLQRVKALGTSPSSPYRIRVPYSDKNKLGEAYIDIKYVNANKFTATYSLGQTAGGMGIWTVYGIY